MHFSLTCWSIKQPKSNPDLASSISMFERSLQLILYPSSQGVSPAARPPPPNQQEVHVHV